MNWRYADKPIEIFGAEEQLPEYEQKSTYFAQQKLDGWCCYLVVDDDISSLGVGDPAWDRSNGLYFLSRRDMKKGGPTEIPVSGDMVSDVRSLGLPNKTILVCEWMKRRTDDLGFPECLYLIDSIYIADQYVGDRGASERFAVLPCIDGLSNLRTPETVDSGFLDFYNAQKELPYTEGIVLKRSTGRLLGDPAGAKKSGHMLKLKWRSGFDGRDIV